MVDAITGKLSKCYTGVVHDVMRAMGLRNFTLPHEITPLLPEKLLCGPVFTIEGKVDETAAPHETLLQHPKLTSKKSGCQPRPIVNYLDVLENFLPALRRSPSNSRRDLVKANFPVLV